MGCSYDPVPYYYWMDPSDAWMKDNGFSHIKHGMSYCHECGVILQGQKHGRRYLEAHVQRCPERNGDQRKVIPMKTEEEIKQDTTYQLKSWH